jgi:hypothetical protein
MCPTTTETTCSIEQNRWTCPTEEQTEQQQEEYVIVEPEDDEHECKVTYRKGGLLSFINSAYERLAYM